MNVLQLPTSGTSRIKVAIAISVIFIVAIFFITRLQPDDFIITMICLFPFGFASYLIAPIVIPFYTNSLLHYILVGLIGFIVGLLIHDFWNRSPLTRRILVVILLLNSFGFTAYIFMQVLRD